MVSRAMIVVGAGSSSRFGSDKLMERIAGRPLFEHTIRAVRPYVDRCVVVCRQEHYSFLTALGLDVEVTLGGTSRTASEMAGLAVLGAGIDLIGMHDAARPLVTGTTIEAIFATADQVGGAVPVLEQESPLVDRRSLRLVGDVVTVQTPQVFRGDQLMAAFVRAARAGFAGHDTVEVVQRFGEVPIAGVAGDPDNLKVTFPSDLDQVRAALEGASGSEPR